MAGKLSVNTKWDNELADNDQDAKKIKKEQKEAQVSETHASKAKKPRTWSFKSTRAVGRIAISPSQSLFALPTGNYTAYFSLSAGSAGNTGEFVCSPTQKRGNPSHWGNECLLLVVPQAKPEGKKLSNHFIDLCDSESMSGSNNAFEHVSERDTLRPVERFSGAGMPSR